MYEDKTIVCADCGQEFTFTASEQAFYAEKGFTDAPKRCKTCRQARKAQRNTGSGYGDDSYGGGSSSYGAAAAATVAVGGGGYDYVPHVRCMTRSAQTAARRRRCRSSRLAVDPVYCNDCFRARR